MPLCPYIFLTTANSCLSAGYACHWVLIDSKGYSIGNPTIPLAIPTPALIRIIFKDLFCFALVFSPDPGCSAALLVILIYCCFKILFSMAKKINNIVLYYKMLMKRNLTLAIKRSLKGSHNITRVQIALRNFSQDPK